MFTELNNLEFRIDHNLDRLDNDKNVLVLLSLLHINGFISDKSIVALFKKLKEGKLLRRVNTYRSNVTKEWYNDETIYNIYQDVLQTKLNPKNAHEKLMRERINKLRKINGLEPKQYKTFLTFDEMIKYLNLYLNRNRNFCIDHLYFEYIKPLIKQYKYDKRNLRSLFNNHDFSNHETIRNNYETRSGSGYCCEDCDGPWENYISFYKDGDDRQTEKDITKEISNFLNTKRTKFKGSYKEYEV